MADLFYGEETAVEISDGAGGTTGIKVSDLEEMRRMTEMAKAQRELRRQAAAEGATE